MVNVTIYSSIHGSYGYIMSTLNCWLRPPKKYPCEGCQSSNVPPLTLPATKTLCFPCVELAIFQALGRTEGYGLFFMGPLLSWDHPVDYSCLLTFVDLLYLLHLLSMDGKMRTLCYSKNHCLLISSTYWLFFLEPSIKPLGKELSQSRSWTLFHGPVMCRAPSKPLFPRGCLSLGGRDSCGTSYFFPVI